MVDWLSLSIPFAYLGILIGSLATFSSLYRKRKAAKSSSLTPWFPAHLQRDIYLSLLHLEPSSTSTSATSSKEKKAPAVPETVLKAALLRRATEDIRRLLELRSQKPALGALLQKGSVGDDLWQRFLRAEKEMEEEVRDVVAEANAFAPNWGTTIFQSANEMVVNSVFRERLEEIQSTVQEEKEWWEKKKASIQEGFMKELEEDSASPAGASASAAAGKQTKQNSDDDDAVLVESGGPAVGGGSGKNKKKKGKK
ncbi:hypothetical protein AJ79_08529 [Helicocarpus griseus UAMH5409]|uniref:Translocation protein sec66 n=1 Tax=Helicocarpus griseus UAMH5409 TaxID=1447875 RepID=A0A2B7WJ67_9EURO|nr:hypothetical protein AJ79_08529 [Helicocarpus griseus UAMH5409]